MTENLGNGSLLTCHHIKLAETLFTVVWKVRNGWAFLFALDSKQSVAWLLHVLFNKIQEENMYYGAN